MKKAMINVVILALVLVNLVLSLMLVFTFVPSIKNTNTLVNKICKIVDLDVDGKGEDETEVAIENLDYVTVKFGEAEEQVFTLKQATNESKVPLVKLSITLAINKKHKDYSTKLTSLNNSMAYVAGQIGDIIIEYTAAEANVNKSQIEKRILKMLKELFNSDFIYDVSLTQFVISN